jgi:hypothetical protein
VAARVEDPEVVMAVSTVRRLSRVMVITALGGLTPIVAAVPASADPPDVTTEINHFETSQHFDPSPNCPGSGATEFAEGTSHLHVVEDGDTLHSVFGETFRILEVPDDPTLPVRERQGTHALTFQLVNDGAVEVFHESFHDNNTIFGDIRLYVTFVAVNGEVKVDHFFGRNLPPEGC